MAASMECIMHVIPNDNSDILSFTTTTWQKFKTSIEKWKTLEGIGREIAEKNYHLKEKKSSLMLAWVKL